MSAYIDGVVDVETPMHLSEPHVVYVYSNDTSLRKISLELPIHVRYQRAQITGGYDKKCHVFNTLQKNICLFKTIKNYGINFAKILDKLREWGKNNEFY